MTLNIQFNLPQCHKSHGTEQDCRLSLKAAMRHTKCLGLGLKWIGWKLHNEKCGLCLTVDVTSQFLLAYLYYRLILWLLTRHLGLEASQHLASTPRLVHGGPRSRLRPDTERLGLGLEGFAHIPGTESGQKQSIHISILLLSFIFAYITLPALPLTAINSLPNASKRCDCTN